MASAWTVALLLGFLASFCEAAAAFNAWGWAYNSGAPISYERRINIVSQMLLTGGNVAATAAFVKVVPNTVRKWWRRWQAVGAGLLMLGPYDSPSNAIEYIHHVEKCYLRRNVAFSRAVPDVALYIAGSMITPVRTSHHAPPHVCARLTLHVLH